MEQHTSNCSKVVSLTLSQDAYDRVVAEQERLRTTIPGHTSLGQIVDTTIKKALPPLPDAAGARRNGKRRPRGQSN